MPSEHGQSLLMAGTLLFLLGLLTGLSPPGLNNKHMSLSFHHPALSSLCGLRLRPVSPPAQSASRF